MKGSVVKKGTEKVVYLNGRDAVSVSNVDLDSRLESSEEWNEARYLLSDIAHYFIPDSFPKHLEYRKLFRDGRAGIVRNFMMRREQIEGEHPPDENYDSILKNLYDQMDAIGIQPLAIDKFRMNFVLKKIGEEEKLVYVDTLDPIRVTGYQDSRCIMSLNVDVTKLRQAIGKILDEKQRTELMVKLNRYTELIDLLFAKFT